MAPPPPRQWAPDPRLGNIPADTLRNRRDEPVRVNSPALEWAAIQLGAVVNPIGRPLYLWEHEIITDIFQSGVDAARVRIVETRILNAPTTLGNQIRVPPGWTFERHNRPVLVHELAHVWQYQTQGTRYITDSVYHNVTGQIATGNRNVAYMNYRLREGVNIVDFTAEEQATIVGDYYELTRIYKDDANPPAWVRLRSPDLPIYERLIGQVRATTPRADTVIYQEALMNQPLPGSDPRPTGIGRELAPTMPILEIRW